ncbi:MAG: hypothetical protein HY662_04190 [Chloroflexi bacterium]|nr:hypothetical protein [Chloroflexota bacterium]
MTVKKTLLKVAPYFVSIMVAFIFYFTGLRLSENIRSLFINIAAAFFAIPLIYLSYQVTQNLSKKRLNKEIFDYAKMQVDREVLSIINQLQKIVYTLEKREFSERGVKEFLSLEENGIKEILSQNRYLGFQIFKKWEMNEENLHAILKNSLIVARLDDDQIISIISMIKSLRYLESIQKNEELYIQTDKKDTSYHITAGKELSEDNIKYPDRYLLLKDLGNNKSLVADFGDFPLYNVSKLLQVFTINEKYLELYTEGIFNLTSGVNNWVDSTGREFVVDTKTFRPTLKF